MSQRMFHRTKIQNRCGKQSKKGQLKILTRSNRKLCDSLSMCTPAMQRSVLRRMHGSSPASSSSSSSSSVRGLTRKATLTLPVRDMTLNFLCGLFPSKAHQPRRASGSSFVGSFVRLLVSCRFFGCVCCFVAGLFCLWPRTVTIFFGRECHSRSHGHFRLLFPDELFPKQKYSGS